jgi:hypothetical protein
VEQDGLDRHRYGDGFGEVVLLFVFVRLWVA